MMAKPFSLKTQPRLCGLHLTMQLQRAHVSNDFCKDAGGNLPLPSFSLRTPVPSSLPEVKFYAQEFRSCSSLCFNCSRRFRKKSFSDRSFCSSAWTARM